MRGSGVGLWFLILFPLIAYVGGVSWHVFHRTSFEFGKPDLIVSIIAFAFLFAGMMAAQRRRWALRFVLLTYSTIAALGVSELALRYLPKSPSQQLPFKPTTRRVFHPKGHMPGLEDTSVFSVNSLGVRGPEMPLEAAEVRILCVGGSTTQCVEVTDELSWPWLLQDKLTDMLGHQVFVGNAGKSGHYSLQHDYLLQNYSLSKEFEWVVVLCGICDVGNLLRNQYEARKSEITRRTLVTVGGLNFGDSGDHAIYYRRLHLFHLLSKAVRHVFAWKVNNPETDVVIESDLRHIPNQRKKRVSRIQLYGMLTELPKELPLALVRYRRDVLKIIETCRRQQQKVVFLTQPTMYHTEMNPASASLIWESTQQGAYSPEVLERVMNDFNRALLDVCQQQGVECIDLASMISKDTTSFVDDCHFNVPGCAKVAACLTEYFVQKLGDGELDTTPDDQMHSGQPTIH